MAGDRVQHPLRRALAAGGLALLMLGGLVGFVASTTADEPVLAVPALHAGDRGDYAATLQYPDGTPAGRRAGHMETLRFQWHGAGPARDGDGVLHMATLVESFLHVTPGLGWTGSWSITATDAATGQPLHNTLRWSDEGASSAIGEPTYSWTSGNFTRFDAEPALCGLRSGLQGAPAPAEGEAVWLEGGCGPEAGLGPGGRALFRREGVDLLDGRAAVRFAPVDGGPVRVWYASGIAAPVQVLQPAVAGEKVQGVDVLVRLVGWRKGEQPMVAADLPTGNAGSPLAFAPRDDLLGPDASGLVHPFPLREALAAAGDDPRTGLQEFLDTHPDAFVMAAYNYNGASLVGPYSTWNLYVTDGKEAMGAYVSRNALGAGPLALDLPRYQAGTIGFQSTPSWLPQPGQLPAELPTVASVLERWTVLRGEAAPAIPAYGFGYWCQVAGCRVMDAEVFAGSSASTFGVNGTGEGFRDILAVDPAGRSLYLSRIDSQTSAQVGFAGMRPLPPLADGPLGSSGFEAPDGVRPAWALPAGRAAAGTILAALLVALATYAWPALKHGAFALFSRLSADELAGHPTRQAILDAVGSEPGIHFQALCRKLGKGRGVVGHHLSKLVGTGQVVVHRKGGFTCYFLKSEGSRALAGLAAVAALKAQGAQQLLRQLASTPERSGLELAEATGLSPSTVHYHLRKLQDAGLVCATARGRSLAMRLTTEGERAATAQAGVVA